MNFAEIGERPSGRLQDTLPHNGVVLLSGLTPGAGSSSLGRDLARQLGAEYVGVGDMLRSRLGAVTERELQHRLSSMPDPAVFDRKLYNGLPPDKRVVVDGKLATVRGSAYLGERETVNVYPYTDPVTAARRILRRDGYSLADFRGDPDLLVATVNNVRQRRRHDAERLGAEAVSFSTQDPLIKEISTGTLVNTGRASSTELASQLTDGEPLGKDVEAGLIFDFYSRLRRAVAPERGPGLGLDSRESDHIEANLGRIDYMLRERFPVYREGPALDVVRRTIRKALVNTVYPAYRLLPKFFVDGDGELQADKQSHKWAPEYYKIARSWEVLKSEVSGKDIIDPFGGPGMLLTYLAARDVPKSVVLADIAYPGGMKLEDSLEGKAVNYQPWLNIHLFQSMLDGLPAYYREPYLSNIKGVVTADARALPFRPNSFDLVVGDPPFGINLNDGGQDLFFEMLPGLLDIGREGGLFMIPDAWQDGVARYSENKGYQAEQLTEDLSLGQSRIPTSIVRIRK